MYSRVRAQVSSAHCVYSRVRAEARQQPALVAMMSKRLRHHLLDLSQRPLVQF